MSGKHLVEKNIKIKVDEDILLKVLQPKDVATPYVDWLNDYNVTRYTEQKYVTHTLESTRTCQAEIFLRKRIVVRHF